MSQPQILVYRGIGHPWTAEPGWDQMYIRSFGQDALVVLRAKLAEAKERFWQLWFLSEATAAAHLFKPSGATRDWQDVSWQGTPRGHGHQFQVGDKVYTDFASTKQHPGRITQHKITEIRLHTLCQTGVQLRVTPIVPGSGFVAAVPGEKSGSNPWIDSAWFRKIEV